MREPRYIDAVRIAELQHADLGQCSTFTYSGWASDNHLHIGRCTGPKYHLKEAYPTHIYPDACERCGKPFEKVDA